MLDIVLKQASNTEINWALWIPPFVTLLIGIATIYINLKNNKDSNRTLEEIKEKELQANLIANARIKWIQEVRQLASGMVSYSSEVYLLSNEYIAEENEERKKEISGNCLEAILEFSKRGNEFTMFFSEFKGDPKLKAKNKSDVELLRLRKKYFNATSSLYKNIETQKSDPEYRKKIFEEYVSARDKFIECLVKYLKTEWEKVKKLN